jgi:rare lipoprotein A
MRYAIKLTTSAAALLLLSSCGSFDGKTGNAGLETASSNAPAQQTMVDDFPSKLGAPYTIGNTSYKPEDVAAYDEVGYASYYGQERAGQPTANGEIFLPASASAAHKTLPMPTYVEVTALETGRTILVRVNDRGPFANDRLIDLSEGAARQLGILNQGVAGVRVRKVNPPEQERAVLRIGSTAAERIETPESLLRVLRDKLAKLPRPAAAAPAIAAPLPQTYPAQTPTAQRPVYRPAPPATNTQSNSGDGRFIREGAGAQPAPPRAAPPRTATPRSVATSGSYVVQMASFGSRARAEQLARKLGASVSASADGQVFRVRYGPYASEAEAQTGLATAKQRGYPQARLFRE